ncbi:hypothetical protein AVEN_148611-1, partial [Araneus ventricosus]
DIKIYEGDLEDVGFHRDLEESKKCSMG